MDSYKEKNCQKRLWKPISKGKPFEAVIQRDARSQLTEINGKLLLKRSKGSGTIRQ